MEKVDAWYFDTGRGDGIEHKDLARQLLQDVAREFRGNPRRFRGAGEFWLELKKLGGPLAHHRPCAALVGREGKIIKTIA